MVSEGNTKEAVHRNERKMPQRSAWLKYTTEYEMRSMTVSKIKIIVSGMEGFEFLIKRTKIFKEWVKKTD